MSQEYAEKRIRKALEACKGHTLKTQQKIIAEAAQDHRLLLSLTQGHLKGIVALWVNRVITRKHAEMQDVPEAPESLEMEPETFGKEILDIMQSENTALFGVENSAPPVKRKQASQRHIDALKQMASKKKPNKE
jgi:hypothetical protein